MKKLIAMGAALAIAATSVPAYADNSEEVIIGVMGGLLGGLIVGAALSDRDHSEDYIPEGVDDHEYLPEEDVDDEYIQRREEFKSKMQGQRKSGHVERTHVTKPRRRSQSCRVIYYEEYVPEYGYQVLRRYDCR